MANICFSNESAFEFCAAVAALDAQLWLTDQRRPAQEGIDSQGNIIDI